MNKKPGNILTQGFSALNATQGHKPSYQQAIYISIPIDGDKPTAAARTGLWARTGSLSVIATCSPNCVGCCQI